MWEKKKIQAWIDAKGYVQTKAVIGEGQTYLWAKGLKTKTIVAGN